MLKEINIELLNKLNWLTEYSFIQFIVKCFIDLPIFIIPVFLLWFWIYYSYSKKYNSLSTKGFKPLTIEEKNKLIYIFYWIVFALVTSLLIQQFVHIDRPEQHLKAGATLLLDHLPDASFPSDHATVSIGFLTWVLLAWYKKSFWIFFVPIIFMNISRIVAWVHWPFDILAGSFVWIICSYLVFSFFPKIKFIRIFNNWVIKILNYIKL
jgi:undecaprenyl-diphosphatase